MATPPKTPDLPPTEPRIPRPPSREEVDQISRDQALIADEWAPEPEHPAKPGVSDAAATE